jgi:hypothetical protein
MNQKHILRSTIWTLLVASVSLSASAASLSDSPETTATQNSPLKITVQKVHIDLEELRDIGLDLKQAMTASRHLYDEVTLQPVSLITEPNLIANGVLISIPIAVQPVSPPVPPRKDRIDMLMNQIRPVVTLLKKNVDDFVTGNQLDSNDPLKVELDPDLKQWVSLVNDLDLQVKKLDALTQGPPYDNTAIASGAAALQEDAKQLEEIRKATEKLMRREEKTLRK